MAKRSQVLSAIAPAALYGLHEAAATSVQHSMYEVAAICYLLGRGYDFQTAHMIVESWEVGEAFQAYPAPVIPGYGPGNPSM